MGKNKDSELDEDSRKRLKKLADKWIKEERPLLLDNLIASDLRLLFEHFEPLKDLIRAIAGTPAGAAPSTLVQETTALREQITESSSWREMAQAALAKTSDELARAQQDIKALSKDLEQCSMTTKQLLGDKQALDKTRVQLEKQVQHLQNQLDDTKAKLAENGQAPSELSLLRQDADLAQQLGLANLPADDTAALIRMVAVLAQRDSLERLWGALKERCESSNRAANTEETKLLAAALEWHNHNWQNRPYRLFDVAARSAYDYERQLRSRHSPSGETVIEMRLLGIADGSNKPLCKALVNTQ